MNPIVAAILTSVAVSALISGWFTVWTARQQREAQRKELLFTKSVELAKSRVDFLVTLGEATKDDRNVNVIIADYAVYAEMYYWLLQELHDKGSLPQNWLDQIKTKFPLLK